MSRGNVNVFQSFTVLLSPGHFPSTGAGFRGDLGRLLQQKCNNQLQNRVKYSNKARRDCRPTELLPQLKVSFS